MHGLVSLLPQPYSSQVEGIWDGLRQRHGLKGIYVTPFPHFSWQIATDYDFEQAGAIMKTLAEETEPFQVRTTGLALFTGETPVLYIPVVKNARLLDFHAKVWERMENASRGISLFYSPDAWMPHISLAYMDLVPQNLPGVMNDLAFQDFNWEMTIDNLTLLFEPSGEVAHIHYHYEFIPSGAHTS